MNKINPDEYVSVSQYARTYKKKNGNTGVSSTYIYKLISQGLLESIKMGEQTYVKIK